MTVILKLIDAISVCGYVLSVVLLLLDRKDIREGVKVREMETKTRDRAEREYGEVEGEVERVIGD